MAPPRDPISVRSIRISNLILGKNNGNVSIGAMTKTAAAIAARRSVLSVTGGTATVSAATAEALNREGLLDAFCLLYNECNKVAVKKRDRNVADFVNKYHSIIEETCQLRVNADDFVVKTLIGKGYFGNVHLVVERQTGDVYAMKKIEKSVVTTSQVKEERDIMARRCSEWITNLQYAFQDDENLYLIMEFLPGGDLLSLMSRHGPFDEDLTRFYLAELTLAIHSLHSMGYVHRDIKPENILIDRFGHIKLADFGNAAALDRDGNVLSLTPVGTPDYIAPELLQTISTYKPTESMHDVGCDYWSMGIIGYELICEITPFHEDNVHATYSKILSHCEDSHHIITFPSDLKVSENFKNLIASLVTNRTKRLSYERIRQHPYFETIQWDTLRSQVPPIIPAVNSDDDTSNFEDVARDKERPSALIKKSITSNMKSNEFCGKDLPFIGYSFVHMEKQSASLTDDSAADDARIKKLTAKLKEMQLKLKLRVEEISKLKQELMRAEQTAKNSDTQTKILQDAKEEINKMKNIIKEKTIELAACKTQIKTLQSSVKIEEEMWEKKEATITDLLRMNRQKYEEAKIASEQRYEKLIAEKKNELVSIVQKLDARDSELTAKTEECKHLHHKMENYKVMLQQFKEQAQTDKADFEQNKMQLTESYEQKLQEMRTKLRSEKESKERLATELSEIRAELDDSISSTKSTQEAKITTDKNIDKVLKRLNKEVEANNKLHALNVELEKKLSATQKLSQDLQQEVNILERDIQVTECGKNLAASALAAADSSPYETARGSLTELHVIEELRADLEAAKENENDQKVRGDKLQEAVEKLKETMAKMNEQPNSSVSPCKPYPSPCHMPINVGEMLEKQNEKLEDRLVTVREQMIVERQAARTANLSLWKVEKKLEETLTAKKMLQRRMELTEEKIKKVQVERDEAQRLLKVAESETRQREECIKELKDEIAAIKLDVLKEHRMWEKAEHERMHSKSEILEHISNVHKLDERLSELQQKLQQTQKRCDAFSLENKRLMRELKEECDKSTAASDNAYQLQIQLKNLQDNYTGLKYACTITDKQLTEVENMLEGEQKRIRSQQEKMDKMYASLRQKDDAITQLKKELQEEQSQKKAADGRIRLQNNELNDGKLNLQELQMKLISQQQQLIQQTSQLFETQERVEVLTSETNTLQTLNANYEREMSILKEENARILSDLFHSKEASNRLQHELKEALANSSELQAEIDELQEVLSEKENHYLQRDIKSEATLAQHKKLIDYLQLKVEDLSQKKKLTLAEKLFGTSANSSKKENISPNAVESSILYRALQEELRRESQRCKNLQEQIDKLNGVTNSAGRGTLSRTPSRKAHNIQQESKQKDTSSASSSNDFGKSPRNQETIHVTDAATFGSTSNAIKRNSSSLLHHRFELALQETNIGAQNCVACQQPIVAGSPYWCCKECKEVAHRKCRSDVSTSCGSNNDNGTEVANEANAPDSDLDSLGKYSYEGKLDTVDASAAGENNGGDYCGSLVFHVEQGATGTDPLEVNCAFEMEEQKILLLGCNSGLYAYHMNVQSLVQIAGIDSVGYIAISVPLAKAILVGSHGESLFQCDFRHLLSRSQASATLKPALEASVLDLPFANRTSSEKWQLVSISSEAENALDSVAIAATSTRIVILKYDLKINKFKPVRALDTATPVSSILYTRHTAIVASDKFFEIDLNTYAAEEFVDFSDQSISHTSTCQPVVAISISRQEFLLCFMECGIFMDEYGCRSRPYDLNWECTPTGFLYRKPFLYISHFQSVQLIRLHRSYSKEAAATSTGNKDMDADMDDTAANYMRAYLPFYMPTLLTNSGKVNVYTLAIQKDSGLQQIYHIDALQAFKHKLNESLETISSTTTSITVGSLTNNTEDSDI